MDSLSSVLKHDHEACDQLFADAEQATVRADYVLALSEFARFRAAAERHFDVEEAIVFPAFEGKTGDRNGPTEVMRQEHAMLRELLVKMENALKQHQAAQYLGLCETLLVLLQQHNFKEENMLYPMIEQTLGPQQDDVVAEARAAGIG